jgi:hypothetical protein
MRTIGLVMLLSLGTVTAAEPVKPTMVELKANSLGKAVAEFNKRFGTPLTLPDEKKNLAFQHDASTSYWKTLLSFEKTSQMRLSLVNGKPELVKGQQSTASIDGAFFLELRKVSSRKDFDTDRSETEWTFELNWEPGVPVLLLDAEPTVKKMAVKNAMVEFAKPTGKLLPRGMSQTLVLKGTGIPRSATVVEVLQLNLDVVAAQSWLTFDFEDLTKKTDTKAEIGGVPALCHPVISKEKRTEFALTLTYPKDHPEFESFQQWAVGNRLQLISPDRSKVIECHPDDSSVDTDGRNVRAVYSFPKTGTRGVDGGDWKGWKLSYRSPGPMVVQKLNFTFKDLPLP